MIIRAQNARGAKMNSGSLMLRVRSVFPLVLPIIISGFRLVAAEKGRVIAAGMWGKIKTVFQMIMTILLIANIRSLDVITKIAMWAALVLTIVSLADYLYKNRDILEDIR